MREIKFNFLISKKLKCFAVRSGRQIHLIMDFYASYLAGGVNNMWDKELGGMPIGRPVLRRQHAEYFPKEKEMPPINPYAIYLARGVIRPLNAVKQWGLEDNLKQENSIHEARKIWNTINEKKIRNKVNYKITYDNNALTEARLVWQKKERERSIAHEA